MIDKLDPAHIGKDAQTWEKIVRKLRAGMMPPSGNPRPDRAATMALVGWLENELDRSAVAFMPPPGLHRLNRTEYGNVIRDLLDLEIDPGKYLPTDDSTRGFDNIAGALGLSSTLVESYVSAAGKISRLAMGDATTPSLVVYRAPEDTSQDYHVLGMPLGTRGGLLVKHVFPSDGEYTITVTPIFGDNMSPQGFGTVPCEKIEFLLDNERLQIMDWQGGGRGGGGGANCGGGAAGGGNRGGNASAAATVEMAEPRPLAQLRQRVQQMERAPRPQSLVRQPSPEQLRLQPVETAVEAVAAAGLPCKFDSPRRRVSIPLL
jgi:hypothetical protein